MVLPLFDEILTTAVTIGLVITVIAFEVLVHPVGDVAVTEYDPAVVTVMFCVVAPFVQR